MNALEHVIRRFGKEIRVGGVLSLTSGGDAALAAAFAELGWSDPYPIEAEPAATPVIAESPIEEPPSV